MDLDPSLAYTAVLELCRPLTTDVSRPLVADLATAMSESNPRNRWAFARSWLAANAPDTLKAEM